MTTGTLQEILNHEAAGSGCWLGSQRVWTSAREECGHLEVMTTAGGASVDNDDGAAANGNLPRISENEENQAIVEIPGLSSELNKIEKSY